MVDVTILNQPMFWGSVIVLYFFLKGIAAGIFGIISFGEIANNEKLKKITGPALWISFAFTYALPFLLIADLAQPSRFWRIFIFGSVTTPMTYGAYMLLLYMAVGGLTTHLYFRTEFVKKYNEAVAKGSKVAILFKLIALNRLSIEEESIKADKKMLKYTFYTNIFVAFSLELYAATLISIVNSRPLWNSPMITLLFLTSAFVSGAAALILIYGLFSYFSKQVELDSDVIYLLGKIIASGLVIQLIFSIYQLIYLRNSAELNSQFFGTTESTLNYFLIEFGLVILLPLLLFSIRAIRNNYIGSTIAAVITLYGAFISKYLLIIDGQELSRSGGTPLHVEFGAHEITIIISILVGLINALLFVYWYIPWHKPEIKEVATK